MTQKANQVKLRMQNLKFRSSRSKAQKEEADLWTKRNRNFKRIGQHWW